MRYLSVCSGIEAATVAWHSIGWDPVAFSEIDRFPSQVLAHHYPDVPNLGDMTRHQEWDLDPADVDLLVGGTPCQSFSVAGLRKGMDDPRGNLALVFLGIADRLRPRWVVWENVPGVLSSNGGRDFGSFLGALGELGYGWSYRVLDAQYVRVDTHPRAVPQRRRRVFVVGHSGSWQRAAAVLLERQSLSGHPAPRRTPREGVARDVAGCLRSGGDGGIPSSRGENIVPVCAPVGYRWQNNNEGIVPDDVSASLRAKGTTTDPRSVGAYVCAPVGPAIGASGPPYSRTGNERVETEALVAFDTTQITSAANYSKPKPGDPCHPLAAGAHPPAVATRYAVRRLTPTECERLQGFPDDYTRIPWRGKPPEDCPDGHRYKALGNSMAVNVMRWIGRRIQAVEEIG